MKTPFILSLAFLMFYLPANSQISFGIKGSYTRAWFSPDKEAKMGGLGTTVTLYKRLNKYLEIGTEPGLVQRGASQSYGAFGETTMYLCCFSPSPIFPQILDPLTSLRTSYIQAPLLIRTRFSLGNGPLSAFAKLGGGPSFLAAGHYETNSMDDFSFEITPVIRPFDFSQNDNINRWDWGLYGGVGLALRLGAGHINFETELYRGLSKLLENDDDKNRSRSFSLGYMIHLN
ncbi:MAG: outer membrane beta-barrel protein [Bacteroidota bacterium]